ncbi:hypothetical protein NKH75_31935 [Mesorhizobium sp. M0984]|uniref:hypothetical protein n=1 Tax=unclassified Mesorhizobium TaxID=325217 RepID=UPI003335F257
MDEPRPGAPRKIGDDKVADVVTATLEPMPMDATQWSTRSMAEAAGVPISTVHRIWRAFSLQPTGARPSSCPRPRCSSKVRDIVGLYLDPPERALVLRVDENTKIQAWSVPSRSCRCRLIRLSGEPVIVSDTAPPCCSHAHFTPTSASWIKQVERFFGLPNASGTQKFSTGRHARQQSPVDRRHATRQAGSMSGTLSGNIKPDHRWRHRRASGYQQTWR